LIVTTGAAIGLGLALAPAQRTHATRAGPFDGMWNVEVNCPDVGDVRAYDWRFPAEVSSGVVTGHYQSPTRDGELEQRIRPEGQALLTMVRKTGQVPVSIGHPRPGTPFRYTANIHFEAHNGFGKRSQRRACTLTFAKG
jgi:hypothetical protein